MDFLNKFLSAASLRRVIGCVICLFMLLPASSSAKTIKSLKITGSSSVTAEKSITLTCKLVYSDKSTKKVTPRWSSSNSSVATVSSAGKVTGKSAGTVTITAVYPNVPETKAGVKTRVATYTVKVTPKKVTLSLSGPASLQYGKKGQYTLKVNGKQVSANWSLDTWLRATVTSSGVVTHKYPDFKDYKVTLTATYGKYSAKKTITLKAYSPGPGGSSGGARINGASSLKAGCSTTYSLYIGGKRVSSGVTWRGSNLITMYSSGRAVARRPTYNSSREMIYATYNGNRYSKLVTVTR